MSKRFTLVLVLVLASSSLIVVKPAQSSITKPSVPEFTVELADHSYDIPTTYSTDPYTGENVTHPGYHVDNKTIEVLIKNQPFAAYINDAGHSINLYYNISMKGHYEDNWTYYPHNTYQVDYLQASGSNYTVVSFNLTASFREGYFSLSGFPSDIPVGGEVDFRVEALAGSYSYYRENWWFMDVYQVNFNGIESGWSYIQTITIPASASSPSSPSPTSTPDQTPEPTPNETPQTLPTEAVIGAVIAVALLCVGLLVYFKKRGRGQPA
jgi:hypothetical protein